MPARSTTASNGRQALSSTTYCSHARWDKTFLYTWLFLTSHLCGAQRSQVKVYRGPHTGIVTQEIPGLIMSEHRMINQLVYVDLDIEATINRYVKIDDINDVDVKQWYVNHLARTKDTISEILLQAEKTIIKQQPKENTRDAQTRPRSKRAIAGAIMGVMALLTIVGMVVGSTMNAVNSVSIKDVKKKNEELRAAITDIQESLATQRRDNQDLVNIIKETIVISGTQNERLDRSMRLHEKTVNAKNLFYQLVDPILYITQTYLRQLEMNIHNLVKAYIPLYFVNDDLVRDALSAIHGADLENTQIRIAYETGSAIPMYIDRQRLHISFLLNIPLVRPDKIYQMKKILNVGTWKGDIRVKINTPDIVAYQNTTDTYFIPRLESCQVFKDLNYLCPGRPFIPDKGGILCGIEDVMSDATLCDVTVTRTDETLTDAILINNKWLVSTNAPNLTITYTRHGTFVTKPIPYSTFTTTIPRDVIVTVGSQTLFYVSNEGVEGVMEMVNSVKTFSIPKDEDLDFMLDKKKSHSLQLLIKENNVSISEYRYSHGDKEMLTARESIDMTPYMVIGGTIIATVWLTTITVAVTLNSAYILKSIKRGRRDKTYRFAVV